MGSTAQSRRNQHERRAERTGPSRPGGAWLALTAMMAAASAAAAPDAPPPEPSGPLVTDRPDFTESTDAVAPGRVQLEMGYTFTYDREDDHRIRDHTAPELLARIGVVENLELRIGWPGYSWTQELTEVERRGGRRVSRKDWVQGASDMSLGMKYKFFDQQRWRPHFGVIAELSVPSGSSPTSAGDVEPGVVWLWAYDLSERLALAGNVGMFVPNDEGDRFFQTTASLALAVALTDQWGTYVEYFGLYPNTEDTDAAHHLNGGLTYLITNDFQLDWRIGFGINEEAPDFFAGVGLAWRW